MHGVVAVFGGFFVAVFAGPSLMVLVWDQGVVVLVAIDWVVLIVVLIRFQVIDRVPLHVVHVLRFLKPHDEFVGHRFFPACLSAPQPHARDASIIRIYELHARGFKRAPPLVHRSPGLSLPYRFGLM
jgi:hypothetical protein